MAQRTVPATDGVPAVRAVLDAGDGAAATRDQTATAVRYLLQLLAASAPGNSVEVRVPPFGAVQAVEGPRHTRGTPPNVVELDAQTWMLVATGALAFADGVASGSIRASGSRADLGAYLPVVWERPSG